MHLLDPFFVASPLTVPLTFGVGYALGLRVDFAADYFSSVAVPGFVQNYGMTALAIVALGIADAVTRRTQGR